MEWKSLIETQYYNVDKTESINITIPEFVKNNKEKLKAIKQLYYS